MIGCLRVASSVKGGVVRHQSFAFGVRCNLFISDRVPQHTTLIQLRGLSSKTNENLSVDRSQVEKIETAVLYEGPFAALTLRLKRVSLTSAAIGIIGLPALSFFYGAADCVPATGQVAVLTTAGVTAVGSTVLLSYCFSPYVHTLERVVGTEDRNELDTNLLRIVTRDILARKVETVFDPTKDVSAPSSSNSRPFCNFIVKGRPFYVHPELIQQNNLKVQLLGEEKRDEVDDKNKTKTDDDEFL
jgi:hypothetical protein